jgi:hypothetical protein
VKPRYWTERLTDLAVRLLPRHQRGWGTAMRAELAAIASRGERWRFALGCLRALATRPAVSRRIGYPLLTGVVAAAALWWSGRFAYAPLRYASVLVVVTLVALGWLGRTPGPLGPVRDDVIARVVRSGGYGLVTLWTVGTLTAMAGKNLDDSDAAAPIFGAVMVSYLAGFLVLTARSTARPLLTASLAGGGVAVGGWTAAVVVFPPIPATATAAVALIGLGMLVAAGLVENRGVHGLRAAAYAGMTAALLIVSVVLVMSAYAPAGWIPDLAPHALSAADDLAQSRSEIQDPYVVLLVLGAGRGMAASLPALGTARWRPARHRHEAA